MVLPSGDHDGERSITFGVFVMMRASPFSAGTVTISPRASKRARVAFGDTWALVSRLLTFTMRARTSGRSPGMRNGTGLGRPGLQTDKCKAPDCPVSNP